MKKSDIPRILLGLLFLFSGIAKSLNPFGFSIKAMEYVAAMGIDAPSFFQPVLGIGIPALEILLGLMLLCKILPRISAISTLAVMAGFTALTLWDLVSNPVGDCGCFGDIIKLTPEESFLKNIALLALALWNLKTYDHAVEQSLTKVLSNMLTFVICSVSLPNMVYNHLPLYDVSGYTEGTVLYDSAAPVVNLLYRNRSTDEIKSFDIGDSGWQDSTLWEFVGVSEGNIGTASFPMLRDDFTDVSRDVLSTTDSLLIVVLQDPSVKPDMSRTGVRTIAVSAYDLSDVNVEHYGGDFSLLRQIMPNSVGGALLVNRGVILDKWALRDCPYFDNL